MTNLEYLIFNLLIITGPLIAMVCDRNCAKLKPKSLIAVMVFVSLPFITWDALVANRWWYFNPQYLLGAKIGPLPLEEIMFFFTVPSATLFLWQNAIVKFSSIQTLNKTSTKFPKLFNYLAIFMAAAAVILFTTGKQYTSAVFALPLLVLLIGSLLKTELFTQKSFWFFQIIVAGLNLLTNSYLTARPIIIYNPETMLNIRLGTIPFEDFLFGFGLITLSQIVYQFYSANHSLRALKIFVH